MLKLKKYMTIKEMRFPQGLRYGTLKEAQKINLDEYIYQHAEEAEFLEFSPGVYDLTPDEVANVRYRYILQVNPSGTGMIFFIPNEPGVVLVDPKMPDEEFITHQQVLGPDSKPMVIKALHAVRWVTPFVDPETGKVRYKLATIPQARETVKHHRYTLRDDATKAAITFLLEQAFTVPGQDAE